MAGAVYITCWHSTKWNCRATCLKSRKKAFSFLLCVCLSQPTMMFFICYLMTHLLSNTRILPRECRPSQMPGDPPCDLVHVSASLTLTLPVLVFSPPVWGWGWQRSLGGAGGAGQPADSPFAGSQGGDGRRGCLWAGAPNPGEGFIGLHLQKTPSKIKLLRIFKMMITEH